MNAQIKAIIGTARPNFLILTPACLSIGIAAAARHSTLDMGLVALVLIAGLLAHISVNMLNEYHDFRSGLDLNTQRTPFSGGSGSLPAIPGAANKVLYIALGTLTVTTAIGLYLISLRGSELIYLGLAGILVVLAYTPVLNKYPFACLVSAGFGFGPVMILGTEIALSGETSVLTLVASLVPFFLVNNLLLLNQFPDIEADKAAGRNHLLIAYGPKTGAIVYLLFNVAMLIAFALTLYFIEASWQWVLLLPVTFASIKISRDVVANHSDVGKLLGSMGPNVGLTLISPLLVSLAIVTA
ncbi:prenyltransferase [Marinobacterium sp. LSUCC0821]|uniref:prenyltransferase n=1 Tax=Marinobacterium sp. LSUCC0821 TaxID=2668067 RepID=UPI0014512211|nr:prenyltransferase [Marinobacterium sp. LSUCC0821]QJD71138.1 prenyltransferase [Marinobacterium sp. LSUCC0821]